MKYVEYGEDRLSKLSLGTVQFGLNYGIANTGGQPTQNDVKAIVDFVYSCGINCFDTAQEYGNSETVLGNALEGRNNFFIVSKLKSKLFQVNALNSVERSLRNLKIESLYALLLHDSNLLYGWSLKNSLRVDDLIKRGKIKYFGVSIYTSEEFQLAISNEKITCIQIPFNLFDQRAVAEKWLIQARDKKKLIFIRSVYLQGLLLMNVDDVPKKLKSVKKYIEEIELLCSELKLSKNELALSFVNTIAKDALILFGCDNILQAKENILTYNAVKDLDVTTISRVQQLFKNVDEAIYNPVKW